MKDYFDGNVKHPKELFRGLCVFSVIQFAGAVFFLWVGLFYDNIASDTDKVLLVLLSFVMFLSSIFYPIISIKLVKNRKKYPRLAALFIKRDQFTD